MKDRRITIAVAVVALVVLGVLGWLLADLFVSVDDDTDVAVPAIEQPATPTRDTPAAERRTDIKPLAASIPVAVPGPTAAGPTEMPASYRRALGAVIGRVIEENGTPVADLRVEIVGGRLSTFQVPRDARYLDDDRVRDLDLIQGHALTQDDGTFRIEDLEPRTGGLVVVDPGGPRNLLKLLDTTPASGADRDIGDIVLPLSVTLTGVVVDARGAPIPGVRVRSTDVDHPFVVTGLPVFDYRPGGGILVNAEDEMGAGRALQFMPTASMSRLLDRLPIPQTTTDEDGRFAVSGVQPGLATLVLDDSRHLTMADGPFPTGAPGGTRDIGTLSMADALSVAGRVVDDDDEPIVDATVMLGTNVPGLPITATILQPSVNSDGEGRFVVEGLRPGVFSAAVKTVDAIEFTHLFDLAPDGAELVLKIPGGRDLTVVLQDEDERPIVDASLFGLALVGEEDNWDQFVPAYVLPSHRLDDRTTQEVPGTYVIKDLDPFRWRVSAMTERHALVHDIVDLTEADASLELTMRTANRLTVQTLRVADESPVEYAMVEVWPAEGGREAPFTSGRTDFAGLVELPRIEAGDYIVRVLHPGLAMTSAEVEVPAEEPLVVLLHGGGTILGETFENGAPPAEPLMVALGREDKQETQGDALVPRVTVTAPDGTFTFTHVEPGLVNLVVLDRMQAVSGFPSIVEAFVNTPLASADVEVPPEGEVPAVLIIGSELEDMETASISGRLSVNGRPAEGWKVRCWGEVRRSAVVAGDGTFDLGIVAAGENTVTFAEGGTTLRMFQGVSSEKLQLEPDEHRRLSVSLSTGTIEGRVRADADGRRLKSAQVTATPQDPDGETVWFNRSETLTLEDGSFRFDTVSAGTYVLRAELDGFTTATSEPFEVRELQTVRSLELRLSLAFEVTGVVNIVGIEDEPDWMWLIARDANGGHAESTRVENGEVFTLDQVGPGDYDFYLSTGLDVEFDAVRQTISQPGEHFELTFAPLPEEPLGEVGAIEEAGR